MDHSERHVSVQPLCSVRAVCGAAAAHCRCFRRPPHPGLAHRIQFRCVYRGRCRLRGAGRHHRRAAQPLQLDRTELARLHELGEAINYNAYGETVADLHYHPADLYRTLSPYRDPRHFIFDEPVFEVLQQAAAEDLARAGEVAPEFATGAAALYLLPDAAWSRRVNGIFGNRLVQAEPQHAHAILVTRAGGYDWCVTEFVRVTDSVGNVFETGTADLPIP